MLGNPLAADIHRVFKKIYDSRSEIFAYNGDKNAREKILRFRRTSRFIDSINCFFIKCGQKPFLMSGTEVDERRLLKFALQLSGYIRDAQGSLNKLKDFYALDNDLIQLYHAAALYTVACNGKISGSKYHFEHHKDYCFWHIDNPKNLATSTFSPIERPLETGRKTLILSMPFHIKPQESELRKWSFEYMHDIFKEPPFDDNIDIYLAHFPIEQPRGEKFVLTMQTIKNDIDYFEPMDLHFVNNYLKPFIARDLQIDDRGRVLSCQPYDAKQLEENFRNLNFFGYCAGGAHAHRWVNTFHYIGQQIYLSEQLEKAMQNIFVANYAFLPAHQHNLYSGVHFMSNYVDDTLRKEPFIKMFNPEMYETVRYNHEVGGAKITVMPDGRNFVIASELPQDLVIVDQNKNLKRIPNQENGHHIAFVTSTNFGDGDNFAGKMLTNVLANAVCGYRGEEVLSSHNLHTPNDVIRNAAIIGQRKHYGY